MKGIYTLLALLLVFASCSLGTLSPEVGGEDDISEEYVQKNAEVNNYSGTGIGTPVLENGTFGDPLGIGTTEALRIRFSGCQIDVNGTAIPGLTVYSLKNAADTDGAYSRNASIPYTAVVSREGNDSVAILTMDLSGTAISNLIEVYGAAATLRANSGNLQLNLDGNKTPGQSSDDFIAYAVTGGPINAVGAARNPQATINGGALGGFAVGTTTLTTTITDSAGTFNLTLASIGATFALEKWSADGWAAVALGSGTYTNTTGVLSYTVPAMVDREIYRQTIDTTIASESTLVRGYTHKAEYDPLTAPVRVINPVGAVRSFDFSDPAFKLEKDSDGLGIPTLTLVHDGTHINIANAASVLDKITVFYYLDGKLTASVNGTRIISSTAGRLVVELPESLDNFTEYPEAESFSVRIEPMMVDDMDTPTVATDDRDFFNTGDAEGLFISTVNNVSWI